MLEEKLEKFKEGQVLLFDKPLSWTSFNVVNKVKSQFRSVFKVKKIKVGHAGTLDPLATGLLIVCTGKYTKRIQEIQDASKSYVADVILGASRPSYDKETEIDANFPSEHINLDLIKSVLENQFTGEIDQVPPVFSALKIGGKKAYEFARAGKELEMKSRKITIYEIKILSYEHPKLILDIHCSKGTYIRSIAHDLGKALNSGAYLDGLRRTKIGDYSLEGALNPEELKLEELV